MNRRKFVQNSAVLATGLSILNPSSLVSMPLSMDKKNKVRLGFIGTGARGRSHLGLSLYRDDVEVTAICDISKEALGKAQELITKSGRGKAVEYGNGDMDYENLLKRDDVDAVIISTPWLWHTPMAVAAMKMGKAVGSEVAGATDLSECWQLVDAYEQTKTPFMILENVCYRRDVLAILNMVRKNIFGELIHLEGGYQHDLREVKFNDGKQLYGGGVEYGEKGYSEARWRTKHSEYRNGDLYPTHGLGPISVYTNNNRGNRFEHLTSTASKARGLHNHIVNHPNGGENHPNAKVKFELGDVVTTVIKMTNGESIILSHDTNLPRPYSLGFRVQGTKGLWMDVNKSIYVEGKSPAHRWEDQEDYMKEYDHPLWKEHEEKASGAGHGGMDFFVLHAFIEAVKRKEPMPLDVYDCASWMAVTALSEQSIAQGSKPMSFPDFTRGKWMNRKPIFGFDERY
ncbi:MAG: Gfo/Idh/MocA family oxidoreductase [Cyclobacteriaceae bacterium]|nr:Gfo/Idh/MocA family oxidoreductase [Cyclobacteriaceae bacterium]